MQAPVSRIFEDAKSSNKDGRRTKQIERHKRAVALYMDQAIRVGHKMPGGHGADKLAEQAPRTSDPPEKYPELHPRSGGDNQKHMCLLRR